MTENVVDLDARRRESVWAQPDRQPVTGPRRTEQYRNVLRAMQAADIPLTDRQREALGDEDHHDEGEAR